MQFHCEHIDALDQVAGRQDDRIGITGIADRTDEFRSSAAHATSVSSSMSPPLPHAGVAHCAGHPSHGDVTTAARFCTGPVAASSSTPFGSPGVYAGPTDGGAPTVEFGVAPAPVNQSQKLTAPPPLDT